MQEGLGPRNNAHRVTGHTCAAGTQKTEKTQQPRPPARTHLRSQDDVTPLRVERRARKTLCSSGFQFEFEFEFDSFCFSCPAFFASLESPPRPKWAAGERGMNGDANAAVLPASVLVGHHAAKKRGRGDEALPGVAVRGDEHGARKQFKLAGTCGARW